MKTLFFTISLLFSLHIGAQTYKDSISFKADLWAIEYVEEAVRNEGDSSNFIWVKRNVKPRKNAIYLDISPKGTLIGVRYPKVMNLSSEGLPNNGFIGEVKYNKYNMHMQSYAKDQEGKLWLVSVGKDKLPYDLGPDRSEEGRIYLTIQPVYGIQSGWYYCIKTL